MVAVQKNMRLRRSNEELILQRRKTNSPTIEDDFAIEEDEPVDEPCLTPKPKTKVELSERGNEVNDEADMLTLTNSDAKEKSKSVHSIFWSLSELEDNTTKTESRNPSDNATDKRYNMKCREGESSGKIQPLLSQRGKKSQTAVQFRVENPYERPENAAIRRERSMDEESNVFDEVSAISVPSRAPSVAVSVTKRIRNTRYPNLRSPRPPRTPRTVAEDSVLTEDVIDEETEYVHTQKVVQSEDEDRLNRFFEQVEDRVYESSHHRKSYKKKKRAGLRRVMNPFLERLDDIFEQLEDIACSEDSKRNNRNATALAAEAFSQLLSQLDKFDPMECQHRYDFYGPSAGYSSDDDVDDDYSESSFVSNEHSESMERTYRSAETMFKEQNHSSVEEKHQTQKMKYQWKTAIAHWKLRQSRLSKTVKENATKAISSCHPEMSRKNENETPSDVLLHGLSDETQRDLVNEGNNTEKVSIPKTQRRWIDIWKNTVDFISKNILDRTQCASSSINVTESSSFDEDQSLNIENENSIIETEQQEDKDEMDFEQDERPPMRRLMETGTDRKSIERQQKCDGVESLQSTELQNGYTLADSLRHTSVSDATKETNRTSKEPCGNKLMTDGSSHMRARPSPSTASPPRIKLDIDSKLMKQQEHIRSPRSSETNETSDLTAVTSMSGHSHREEFTADMENDLPLVPL